MLVVQKYGGSSLATTELVKHVATKITQTVQQGNQVVVVVSAMGDTTDDLIARSEDLVTNPVAREMDALLATGEMQSAALMAMTLSAQGTPARSFSGWQAGIRTDGEHGKARIQAVNPEALQAALAEGIVPVVTGFQGIGPDGAVTTLGRGGSDLTAIAIAAALDADRCEIYSDVAGVFTADPRVVPLAHPLAALSYDEMLELASQGAQVLQTQAVLYARGAGVAVHARSTFDDEPGTVVRDDVRSSDGPVTAVALDSHITKMALLGVPDTPGVAAYVCEQLASSGINIDLVFQAVSHEDERADIALTIADSDRDKARGILTQVLKDLGGRQLLVDSEVAKVSAVGAGVRNHPGVAATMFRALADAEINIQMISTSEIKIACIIHRHEAQQALNRIHAAFNLEDRD
ncbi:aspartate kinase [Sulfobacillus acidophilus TPY]|uniref:Aspartokinase n=1 Tax=Sulfobacillus acidophilus (strain ATCC 700253 / DSM 10332 / NAL) TaxID=679936 RepID=G8TSS1_SULAD|nr:aspartate kinase [Sulfobacillus acidophilus TPY]AEW04448.1 aspartate kinase [Sulfobacillus acidophilus DSM 10332]